MGLAWKGAKKENMVVPKAIQEYREAHNIAIDCGPEYDEIEENTTTASADKTSDIKSEDSNMKDAEKSNDDNAKETKAAEMPEDVNSKVLAIKTEDTDTDMKDTEKSKDSSKLDAADSDKSDNLNDSANDENIEKEDLATEKEGKSEEETPQNNEAVPVPVDEPKSLSSDDNIKKETQDVTKSEKPPDDAAVDATTTTITINGDQNEEKADTVEAKINIPAIDTNQIEGKNDMTPGTTENDTGNKLASSTATDNAAVETVLTSTFTEKEEAQKPTLSMEERSGKFAAMAKKRGLPAEEENEKSEKRKEKEEKEAEAAPVIYVLDSKGRRVKVLWHLHNRDAPKFVQQCTTCSREILQGYRFHCPICADFDQCQDCVQNPNTPRHPHQLKPIAVSGQQTELTEAQRKERQRSIQLHMTLLQHAATCNSPKCPSANCTKMKGLLKHGAQCQVKATGGCNVCKRIWALLQIHARQCEAQPCPVPNCMAIRERVRQLKKQQQAMDDRRRQEMNRVYRGAR